MKFKVFSILAMVALVFVFTTTANPAPEEHVSEMVQKSEHASKDHHAAAGKAASSHSYHVKRVKGGKKREPIRRSREAKAAPLQEHPKGIIALKQEDSVMGVPIKLSIGIRQEMKKPYQFVRRTALVTQSTIN